MNRPMLYVDADACPVKQETYRVAQRHGLKVTLVSNSWMRIPTESWLDNRKDRPHKAVVRTDNHFDPGTDNAVKILT